MSSAMQLLVAAARQSQKKTESFNTDEIKKKLNEIKYLSSQKKVPKLSLRKEIIHLENKLQKIFELDKALAAQRKHESAKEGALKRQITILKKKLEAAGDKDIQKKVDKLSHLLGDFLAKRASRQDIHLALAALKGKKVVEKTEKPKPIQDPQARMRVLQGRLQTLKHELTISKELGKDVTGIEEKVKLLEGKLYPGKKEISVEKAEVKHTVLFGDHPIKKEDVHLEKELPLPPPPRVKD